MAKQQQILEIEPESELRFRGPFTGSSVTSYIKLTNPSDHKVYFKIKTTAPKRYCVRPNSGFLKPKAVTQIAVTLQPLANDLSEKNKHKFMVQTVIAADDDDIEDYTDMWKSISPDQLMDSKLKCIFENPAYSATTKSPAVSAVTKSESDATTEKNKATTESFKTSSPKTLGDTEEKLLKAAQEVNMLRVEESNLRQENLKLQENLLRLQQATLATSGNVPGSRALTSQKNSQIFPPSISIVLAIVMVIVGYILGKMI